MTYVLCWDIDGTLLTTGRAGIFAWEEAVLKVLGVSCDLHALPTAGLTDLEVAKKLLVTYSQATEPDLIIKLVRAYEHSLPSCLPRKVGHVLPGVREVLEYFKSRTRVTSMLLTGNTRSGAEAKLMYYGLNDYFKYGAFADDSVDRVSIAFKALSLARQSLEGCVSLEKVYVIGDTPYDIRCGKAIGARTVAVASGSHTFSELEQDGPWLILQQLPDPKQFAALLGLGNLPRE